MVGEGVLNACLASSEVEQILVINRKPCGVVHPKLKEILHKDFLDISPIAGQLSGYNACYFCLGISSIGVSEEDYKRMTYDLTMHVAQTLAKLNPDMTFCYVSGTGTDSSEKGSLAWARVKGKTENDLMKLPFKRVYAFRPGFMKPDKDAKNALRLYGAINWLYPSLRRLFPSYISTLREVGDAMIKIVNRSYPKQVLEVKDIVALAAV